MLRRRKKIKKASEHARFAAINEIQSLLSTLQLERTEAENQAQRDFVARNQALWDGIDKAIALVQAQERKLAEERKREEEKKQREMEELKRKREQEQRAAEEKLKAEQAKLKAEEDRKKAEEESKRAKEEQERAQASEQQRQQAEQARLEKERKAAQANELAKRLEAERASVGEKAVLTSTSQNEKRWKKWVEHQRQTKDEVINRLKADDGLRKMVGAVKRKITRRIGQIVNTRESILKIVSTYWWMSALFAILII